jgi:hypothetical protein
MYLIQTEHIPLPVTQIPLSDNNCSTWYHHVIRTDDSQNYSERRALKMFPNISFRYLGTTLTNKKNIHHEIKSRLNSGNACYHSVQNILSSLPTYT